MSSGDHRQNGMKSLPNPCTCVIVVIEPTNKLVISFSLSFLFHKYPYLQFKKEKIAIGEAPNSTRICTPHSTSSSIIMALISHVAPLCHHLGWSCPCVPPSISQLFPLRCHIHVFPIYSPTFPFATVFFLHC